MGFIWFLYGFRIIIQGVIMNKVSFYEKTLNQKIFDIIDNQAAENRIKSDADILRKINSMIPERQIEQGRFSRLRNCRERIKVDELILIADCLNISIDEEFTIRGCAIDDSTKYFLNDAMESWHKFIESIANFPCEIQEKMLQDWESAQLKTAQNIIPFDDNFELPFD